MTDNTFNQKEYLERINLKRKINVDLASLKAIHHAQLYSIPFENFNLCLNRPVKIDEESIVQKLIKNKRGGYCFEVNGLLLMALTSFDFDVRPLLARVHLTGSPSGKTHQITLVTIENKQYIVDAGFGSGSPIAPLPLIANQEFKLDYQLLRLIETKEYGYMLQGFDDDEWKNMYSFTLNYICQADKDLGNYYTSTNENSHFVTSRVAALRIKNGIVKLYNNRLTKVIDGKEEITYLNADQTFMDCIEKEFNIELDASFSDLKPVEEVVPEI